MEYLTTQERLSSIAKKLGWGYILIHAHINLGTLDILPDWLGYLLIYQAICLLEDEEESAGLLKPMGIGLGAWAGICWVMKLFGVSVNMYLITLIVSVISLYFHFQLLTNMAALAEGYDCPQSGTLLKLRNVRVVMETISVILLSVLAGTGEEWAQWMVIVLAFVQLIVMVVLMFLLFDLSRTFRDMEIIEGTEEQSEDEGHSH